MNLLKLSIAEVLKLLRDKQCSPTELLEQALLQINQNQHLNAFITLDEAKARAAAKLADQAYAKGSARALEGIPIAQKDCFATKGTRTTAGSHILHNFVPPYDAGVVERLNAAGAIAVGKTNMDEFAMGSTNTNSYFGPAHNPWRSKAQPQVPLVPGGSSGGSAAAVAANLVFAATGTDTGGSIRQPAALCGIVGLKPTYGRCSRYGIVAFASSLDQAGPFTRTVADAALMLEVMAGHDPRDSTSANRPVEKFSESLGKSIKGLRVGLARQHNNDRVPADMRAHYLQTAEWLKAAGAILVEVDLPEIDYSLPVYYVIAPAEASANLARYDGVRYGLRVEGDSLEEMYENTRAAGFGNEVKRRIMMGTYVLSSGYYDAHYLKAQRVRAIIARELQEAFAQVDLLLAPTTPTTAFPWDPNQAVDPVQVYLNDIFTVPVNLAGLPAISVPVGVDANGLPVGMQLIGPAFDEALLLNAAAKIEEAAQFQKFGA